MRPRIKKTSGNETTTFTGRTAEGQNDGSRGGYRSGRRENFGENRGRRDGRREDYGNRNEQGGFGGERRGGNFGGPRREGGFGGERRGGSFGGPRREGGFGGERRGGSFGGPRREGGFGGERREGSFRGPRREGGFGGERREGSFRGPRREGGFGGERRGGSFGGPRREGGFGGPRREGGFGGERREDFKKRMIDRPVRPANAGVDVKPAVNADGKIRLNKFISNSGICSRREADEFIVAGLVSVNGEVITEMGVKVSPDDDIRFNGEKVKGEQKVYIIMNKPKDFVTTISDPHADKNVMQLISPDLCPERIFPVGRLDKSTTGVLLLTNDGELTEKLTHPSFQKKKIYQVTLDKNFKGTDMEKLIEGVELEDGMAYADEASYVGESKDEVGLEIHSGRNRIVRRMFEALGYKVRKLDRVYFAGLTKKNLRRGQWRFLTEEEITKLRLNFYE